MPERPRVLVVSFHYPPELTPGSFRAQAVSFGLARRGWDVTVLTAAPESESRDGIRVIRAGSPPPWVAHLPLPAPLAGRLRILWNDNVIPDRHTGWQRPLAAAVERLHAERPFDAVVSTSPPHSTHAALVRVRRTLGFRWAADFRDPWSAPSRYPRGRLFAYLHRRIEARVLAGADAVFANTRGNREALLRAFPAVPAGKIFVVPNAFEDRMREGGTRAASEPADLTYAGEVYKGMMGFFAEALARVRERHSDLLPSLALYGSIDPREERVLAVRGVLDILQPRGVVSFEESLSAMQRARALLLLLPRGEAWASCVPSKLYPYLAAGRPILAFVPEGDAADTIRATGAGVVVTTEDPQEAAATIMDFVVRVRAGGTVSERNEAAVDAYASSVVVGRIDHILRSLIGGGDAE